MKRNTRLLKGAVWGLAAVAGMLGVADGAHAQQRGPAARAPRGSTRITRARGVKTPKPMVPPPRAWKGKTSLSVQAKKAALAAIGKALAPGTVYAQVLPSDPLAEGKMSLMMVRPEVVNPSAGYAVFPALTAKNILAKKHGFAGLWVKSERKGARYLVDCALTVESDGKGPTSEVRVRFEDNTLMRQSVVPGQHHVSWVMESPDANWHSFRVAASGRFSVHACETTRL